MVKVECTECSQKIWASDDTVPNRIQPGEWFEMKCPACDEGHYMELAESDSEAVKK